MIGGLRTAPHRPAWHSPVAVAALALPFLLGSCIEQSAPRKWKPGEIATMLRVEGLEESSGVAPSRIHPGAYYTHNDDDPQLRFWRFTIDGKASGPFTVPVPNRDMEDMASARLDEKNYLYFADIGDNAGQYSEIKVVRCQEPAGNGGQVSNFDTFVLNYPDGPHNAEAFFVHPTRGDFWIVEKTSAGPAKIYVSRFPRPGKNKLQLMGTVQLPGAIPAMRLITGGGVTPDGRYVTLRTYTSAYEFPVGADFDRWFEAAPQSVSLPIEAQGEAIGYSLEGTTLISTSEGNPCQVSKVTLSN